MEAFLVIFDMVDVDSTPTNKEEGLWSNSSWANDMVNLSQASGTAGALAATLTSSNGKASTTPQTASRYWLTQDNLPVDLADFLFAEEPGSIAGNVLERRIARLAVR